MELVKGETLEKADSKRKTKTWALIEIIAIMEKVIFALVVLAERGIIHKDIH